MALRCARIRRKKPNAQLVNNPSARTNELLRKITFKTSIFLLLL